MFPPVRYVRPGLLVFFVALLASISVHLPVYQVLGTLSKRWRSEVPPPQPPAEIDFEVAERDEPQASKESPTPEPPPESERKPEDEPEPEAKAEARKAPRPKLDPPKPLPMPAPPVPTKPPERSNRLAVDQRSDDPNVEPPPDAEYIAEENRRVLEETVASVTNLARDEVPQQGAPAQDSAPGNAADEDEVAEMEQVDSESRVPQEGNAEKVRPPTPGAEAQDEDKPSRATPQPDPSRAPAGAQSPQGPSAPESEPPPLIIHDGDGTLVIRRPAVRPSADRQGVDPAPKGAPGRAGERAGPVNLSISQRQFAELYGEERLRQDREAYMAQRKSKAVGGDRSRQWRKFRAAIENYVTKVRPGEQTALNAAASPFASYLATIHRRIHAEFALGFLRNISLKGGPLSDPNLRTRLEIIINADGSLHQIGIIETSGVLPFDFGAFDAVSRAAPFTKPPSNILSADGRVYVHWGFHRDMRQCGTFNASPFILRGDDLRPKTDQPRPLPPGKSPLLQKDGDAEMGAAPRQRRNGALGHTFN